MLPPPGDPLPPPITQQPERPGLWRRFQGRQRWSAYGGAAVLVLAAIGGVVGEQPAGDDTVTEAPVTTAVTVPRARSATVSRAARFSRVSEKSRSQPLAHVREEQPILRHGRLAADASVIEADAAPTANRAKRETFARKTAAKQ